MPGGQRGAWGGGTLAMGAARIDDWCINILQLKFATQKYSTKELYLSIKTCLLYLETKTLGKHTVVLFENMYFYCT